MAVPPTALGADPDQLRALATSMRRCANQLSSSVARTRSTLVSTAWTGPDAGRFRTAFDGEHRAAVTGLCSDLNRCVTLLERQADQQDRASADEATPLPVAGPTTGTAIGTTANAATNPTKLPPMLPLVERRITGNVDARLGLGLLTGGRELTIAELDNGLRRVTISGSGGIGAAVGAGASASFSFGSVTQVPAANNGGSVDARARAGAIERVSWEVPPDRVDDLLAMLAARFAVDAAITRGLPSSLAGAPTLAIDRAAGAADWLVQRATGRVAGVSERLGPPEPTRTERLAEVEVSASGGAGVAGQGAGAVAGSSLRVGWADRGADRSLVVETTGAATAAATSSLLRNVGATNPAPLHAVVSTRWEIPVQGPTAQTDPHMTVRVTTNDGNRTDDTVARLGFDDAPNVERIVAHLRNGDLASAADIVESEVRSVGVRAQSGTIEGTAARGSGRVDLGAGVGLTGRLQHTIITR